MMSCDAYNTYGLKTTLMDIRLPIPKNWQDFESMCQRLWSEIWNDPNAQKNGRQGQPQNGIDIFGSPIYSRIYAGVQCKDKDERLGSELKEKELIAECDKAMSFVPNIQSYTVATTAPRDTNIQSAASRLTNQEAYPFTIQVWSWDDIESEIAYRPAILENYYSKSYLSEEGAIIDLNRFSSKDRLNAYFTRPYVKHILPNKIRESMLNLAYELSDNAYYHGQATNFRISINENKIIFIDNGRLFNPLTDLNATLMSVTSHVGSFVFDRFFKKFNGLIRPGFTRKISGTIEENMFEIEFLSDSRQIAESDFLQLDVDLKRVYGRTAAENYAESLPMSGKIGEIILTVTDVYNISAFVEFIRIVLGKLKATQKLTISIPRSDSLLFLEELFKDERLSIQIR